MPPMHTLLLADDSVTIQRVLALAVTGHPFEVVIAKDGQDAIDRMATVRPDLVLADTNMPCVDGYGVAEWVRRQPHLEGVPVLLLASALDPVDEQRFRMSGAAGVLEKPFEPTHVIDRVKELLGIRPSADSDGSRLVTPIKVIRPPDRPEPAPVSAPAQIPPAPAAPTATPEPATAAPEPASPVHEALLAAEHSGTAAEPWADEGGAAPDPAPPAGGSADDVPLPAALSREMWDELAARLESRLGLPDVREDLRNSMTIAVNDAVARALREHVASEVAAALADLRPAMEQAVRDSIASALADLRPATEQAVKGTIASAMPAAVAQATDGVRREVQSQVASAVAAAMPAAMAEAAAGALGQSVRGIVLETSERLVKEEIARIRGK